MFVESKVEIKVKDRMALMLDDHELKLWVQRAFRDMCCYRIDGFNRNGKLVQATVALKTDVLPPNERQLLEERPNDTGGLRAFMEKMFNGKGECRCIGDPTLRAN